MSYDDADSGAPAPAPPSEPTHLTDLRERAFDPRCRGVGGVYGTLDAAREYAVTQEQIVATLTARLAETEREREALQQQVHEGKTENGQLESRSALEATSCAACFGAGCLECGGTGRWYRRSPGTRPAP